ncbi:MAG: hypothetical protein H6591_08575 [Flavobacteriales bacterium]|nr:hypothetical protein [Flavobacteriales bacterium]
MIRRITLVILSYAAFSLNQSVAQSGAVHVLRSAIDIDAGATKLAMHVIRQLDPAAVLSVDGRILKVRISDTIAANQLIAALNDQGGAYALVDARNESSSGFPVRIDTGDPAGDDARYDAAKRAWIEAHPAEYDAIRAGTQQTPATKSP